MQPRSRILVVDDNPTNIKIAKAVLGEDYDLALAVTGEEALEIAPAFRPDVILLDIMLPGIDGYEVCRKIRGNPALRHTKIIMVSAKAMISGRLQGYEAGADDYITKPYEEDELLAKVRVFLRLKSGAGWPDGQAICADAESRIARLTPREHEVLDLLVGGKHTKAIAAQLGVSCKTVEAHRANLLRKMEVDDVVQLLRLVLAGLT